MRARQQLRFGQRVLVREIDLRQLGQARQLEHQDVEVVMQRERAILGEQLVLGAQLAAGVLRRVVEQDRARGPDAQDQQAGEHQRDFGA